MRCPECDTDVPGSGTYCPECGTELMESEGRSGSDEPQTPGSDDPDQTADTDHQQPQQGQPQQPQGGQPQQPQQGQPQQPQRGQPQQPQQGQPIQQSTRTGSGQGSSIDIEGIVERVPVRRGVLKGLTTYTKGLLLSLSLYVLVLVEASTNTDSFGYLLLPGRGEDADPLVFVSEGAWFLYSALGVDISYPPVGDSVNLITEMNDVSPVFLSFKLLGLAVPFVLFVAGYKFAAKHYDESDSLVEQVAGGIAPVLGFLPLVVGGAILFSQTVNGVDVSVPVGSAVLRGGITYPVVLGGLGGATASVLRGNGVSIESGQYYGFAAFVLSICGTFALTMVNVEGSIESWPDAIMGVLIVHAHVVQLALPSGTDAELPTVLYSLAVVVSVGLVAALATRNFADDPIWAAVRGASVAVGFAIGVFTMLLVILVPQSMETTPLLFFTPDFELFREPTEIVLFGGFVYPAVVGAVVGAVRGR